MNNLTHQRQYKFLAVRRWKELLKDELPDGVDLWHVTKYCSTTRSLYLETADWLDKSVEFYGVNYIKKNIMVRNRHGEIVMVFPSTRARIFREPMGVLAIRLVKNLVLRPGTL